MQHARLFLIGTLGVTALMSDACSEPDPGSVPGVASTRAALSAVEIDPPSTLLPPSTASLAFTMKTDAPAFCRYSVGSDPGFDAMTPFTSGDGTTDHGVTFEGLSGNPKMVDSVYVRCDADAAFLLTLQYRSLAEVRPPYPRTGNLWGWWDVAQKGLDHAARIDLFLGAGASGDEIDQLRGLNPNILVLTSINTVEEGAPSVTGLPDDYYLKDTNGNPIEVWPGAFRVNITKPEVAEFKAREAYKTIEDTSFRADGCFFDNFLLMPSWLTQDMWGNPVQVDADEDGQPDDPAVMDAAWRQGAIAELQAFRKLMPNAYVSGHAIHLDKEVGPLFNGEGIGFLSSDVIEGEASFPELWSRYQDWWTLGKQPAIPMLESSTRDDIAYGFSYEPADVIPPSTLEFARTYYPDMRFGLAFSLMGEGYFAHEIGDTWHGNDWWYDELDANLGQPCGPAARVDLGGSSTADLIDNGGFEQPLDGTWTSWVNTAAGAAASVSVDSNEKVEGVSSLLVDVSNAGEAVSWHVAVYQSDRSLVQGKLYDLTFRAKADSGHTLYVNAQKGSADWDSYGLWQAFPLTTDWVKYTASFEATATASDARVGFNFGESTGRVWVDDVHLTEHPPDVFAREFTGGMAILNATRQHRAVPVADGFSRLKGDQAPRVQFLVDDTAPAFSSDLAWQQAEYDSGEWTAVGPFYHDWGPWLHRLDGTGGNAEWSLEIQRDDTYTIEAWWPGGPDAGGFTHQAIYEVVAGGAVVATQTLDQTIDGNQWHQIAEVQLAGTSSPSVRLHKGDNGTAIADALHVFSKTRWNDGSAATEVDLPPMDGIVLQRTSGLACEQGAGDAGGDDGGVDYDAPAGDDGSTDDGGLPTHWDDPNGSGCGCRAAHRDSWATAWPGLLIGLGLLARRARRRSRAPT